MARQEQEQEEEQYNRIWDKKQIKKKLNDLFTLPQWTQAATQSQKEEGGGRIGLPFFLLYIPQSPFLFLGLLRDADEQTVPGLWKGCVHFCLAFASIALTIIHI